MLIVAKIRTNFSSRPETTGACSCSLRTALPWTLDHRPHPFPIQWLYVRNSCIVPRSCKKEIDYAPQWSPIRSPPLLQTYILVPGAGVLRLPSARILSGLKVNLSTSVGEYLQAGDWISSDIWNCIWTFCLLGTDPAAIE